MFLGAYSILEQKVKILKKFAYVTVNKAMQNILNFSEPGLTPPTTTTKPSPQKKIKNPCFFFKLLRSPISFLSSISTFPSTIA